MKKTVGFVLVLALATAGSLFAQNARNAAPGLAETFYRGITTIAVSDTTEIITVREVVSSEVETRAIGTGQGNGNGNSNEENYQDRLVEVVSVTVIEVRTVVSEQHHGVAHSKGKYLGTITTVTETVLSSEIVSAVGDWGRAYSLPSGIR